MSIRPGHLHTDPETGDILYYALNSTGGSPIYRISGWEGWHRATGKITPGRRRDPEWPSVMALA